MGQPTRDIGAETAGAGSAPSRAGGARPAAYAAATPGDGMCAAPAAAVLLFQLNDDRFDRLVSSFDGPRGGGQPGSLSGLALHLSGLAANGEFGAVISEGNHHGIAQFMGHGALTGVNVGAQHADPAVFEYHGVVS